VTFRGANPREWVARARLLLEVIAPSVAAARRSEYPQPEVRASRIPPRHPRGLDGRPGRSGVGVRRSLRHHAQEEHADHGIHCHRPPAEARRRRDDDAPLIPILARKVREVEAKAQRGKLGPTNRVKFQVIAFLVREERAA
jgi:hypothetical protein